MDYSQSNNVGRVAEAIHHLADNLLQLGVPIERMPPLAEKRNEDMDYAATRLITVADRLVNIVSSGLDITVTHKTDAHTEIKVRWVDRKGD